MADKQVKITVPDKRKQGKYANFLVVSHSPHEFTLDFCQLQPGADSDAIIAEVVTRIRVAPTMVGKIIQALNTNLSNYEEKWGNVKAIG